MAAQIGAICRPKFRTFWDDYSDILSCEVVNAIDRLSISYFVPKIWAVKFAVKLRSRPKRWFLGPRFVGGGINQISDMHFQITLTSDHVVGYGLVPFSELRD